MDRPLSDEFAYRCAIQSDISDHLPRLHAEASIPGVRVLELGVRSGNSTAAFLYAAEQQDGHVWSVDIAPPAVPFHGNPRWHLTIGDDLAPQVHLAQPDMVDVLFIDTSHTYDQTTAELYAYWRNVKPGGVILLHDIELERPEASPPSDPPFPVRKAVDEFVEEFASVIREVEYVSGCYGLGVIRMR